MEKMPVNDLTVPVSVRWDPRLRCYPALIRMPRRSFHHVVATGGMVRYAERIVLR